MRDIERLIEEKIINEMDLTEHKDQINKAVNRYFASKGFAESLAEALYNEDIATEIAAVAGKKLVAGIKDKVSVVIG